MKLGPKVKRLRGLVDSESDRDAETELPEKSVAGREPRPSQNTPAPWISKIKSMARQLSTERGQRLIDQRSWPQIFEAHFLGCHHSSHARSEARSSRTCRKCPCPRTAFSVANLAPAAVKATMCMTLRPRVDGLLGILELQFGRGCCRLLHQQAASARRTTTTKAKADQGPPTADPPQRKARAERRPVTPFVSR